MAKDVYDELYMLDESLFKKMAKEKWRLFSNTGNMHKIQDDILVNMGMSTYDTLKFIKKALDYYDKETECGFLNEFWFTVKE